MERKVVRKSDGKIYESAKAAAHDNFSYGTDITRAILKGTKRNESNWEYLPDEIFGETWKEHPYIPNLKVSDCGRVQFKRGRRTFGLDHTKEHYFRVGIRQGKTRKYYLVHRLVADTFLGVAPNSNSQVNHIDRGRKNNYLYNLEWCSPSENQLHWRNMPLNIDYLEDSLKTRE